MSDYLVTRDWADTISFDRMHALAQRGYRACLGNSEVCNGFARVDLQHPKTTGSYIPPRLTLWSNGIVATDELLWPMRYVQQEDGAAPDWQKYIDVSEEPIFIAFLNSVPMPNIIDLYIAPLTKHMKAFLARLVFGTSLCLIIAFTIELLIHAGNI